MTTKETQEQEEILSEDEFLLILLGKKNGTTNNINIAVIPVTNVSLLLTLEVINQLLI